MKACLAAGYPFVFGFTVYTKFESQEMAKTGVLSMPGPDEDVIGGHAVLAVGYDDAAQTFLVRDSWGADWGQGRLLHDAVRLPHHARAVVRLLDHPHRHLIVEAGPGIAVAGR
jgi:hypothetical protein